MFFPRPADTLRHTSSGVPGDTKCSRSSGGVIGENTTGVSGGGPGGVLGDIGGVTFGDPGTRFAMTLSGNPIGKFQADLSKLVSNDW